MSENKCFRCGKSAEFSILLAASPNRWHIPNQSVRNPVTPPPREVWLCRDCAHSLDDLVSSYLPTPSNE